MKHPFIIFVFIFLNVQYCKQCGPGSQTSRDKARKPMVVYQRLPDVEEESISGSGMFRKMVTRDSDAFKTFITNHNKNVVFDGSGNSNRLMTPRCSEKLNKLAELVKREWPNVKLRVIGAYDEHGQHPPNSLHYEGRAVDVATTDRDSSKNGALGVLAFRAGFDWVYFESKSVIHASVVAENEVSLKYAECFPGSSEVTTKERGIISMRNLRIGENVLTYRIVNHKWQTVFTEVIGFLDSQRNIQQSFIRLETSNGGAIETTKSHLVYAPKVEISAPCVSGEDRYDAHDSQASLSAALALVFQQELVKKSRSRPIVTQSLLQHMMTSKLSNQQSLDRAFPFPSPMKESNVLLDQQNHQETNQTKTTSLHRTKNFISKTCLSSIKEKKNIFALYASSVAKGMPLFYAENRSTIGRAVVIKVTNVWRAGAFAPLTREGSLVVNGIYVSCYAKTNDTETAHGAFALFRFISTYLPSCYRAALLNWYVRVLITINNLFNFVTLY